jgi:hypothetical protein
MFVVGGIGCGEWERFLAVVFALGCGRMLSLIADESVDDQSSERCCDEE